MINRAVLLIILPIVIVSACILVHLANHLQQRNPQHTARLISIKLSVVSALAIYAGFCLSALLH